MIESINYYARLDIFRNCIREMATVTQGREFVLQTVELRRDDRHPDLRQDMKMCDKVCGEKEIVQT